MGFDAVAVGAIGSVVLAIVIIAVISYKIVKKMDDKSQD